MTALRSIGVVRLLPGVGDLLCAVPALRRLREAHPCAHVTLLGLPSAVWFAKRYHDLVDDLVIVPSHAGLAEFDGDHVEVERALDLVRACELDVVVQMHGSGGVSNGIAAGLGARTWIGLSSDLPPGTWRHTDDDGVVGGYPHHVHEIDRCIEVVTPLGATRDRAGFEFPLHDSELAHLANGADACPERYVVMHPGASRPDRRWSAAAFADVIDHVSTVHRLPVVITGTAAESAVVDRVRSLTSVATVDLCGRTSMGSMAAVLHRARALVTNDTGVAHLGVAVGTPTVTVVGTSDRIRWAHDEPPHVAVVGPPGSTWPDATAVCRCLDSTLSAREWAA